MESRSRNHTLSCVLTCLIILSQGLFAVDKTFLPKTTGPYGVGRTSFHLVDASRTDELGSRADHKREFVIFVWYPADSVAAGAPAEWLPAEWVPLETNGLLGRMLGRSSDPVARDIPGVMRSVVVNAHELSPIADSPRRFPLLLFGPGNMMFPTEYTSVLEEMASQGYIVIGYVPTGFVSAVSFPDGRVTRVYARPSFKLWTGDMEYAIDQAAAWNAQPKSMFFGRLDMERVGVLGHSAGANAVAVLCSKDKRVRAGLVLDPGLLLPKDATGLPFLELNAENAAYIRRHPNDPDITAMINERRGFFERSKPGIMVTLAGTDHNSFTDMAVIKAFDRPGDGAMFIDTTRAFVREFFGEFLLGRHADLIRKGSAKYPIAKVETTGWPESTH
jgi:hypothetical protein